MRPTQVHFCNPLNPVFQRVTLVIPTPLYSAAYSGRSFNFPLETTFHIPSQIEPSVTHSNQSLRSHLNKIISHPLKPTFQQPTQANLGCLVSKAFRESLTQKDQSGAIQALNGTIPFGLIKCYVSTMPFPRKSASDIWADH